METEVINLLKSNNINFEEQKTFDWLKYKSNLYLDFYLPDYNIAIECQGRQHFEPTDFTGTKPKEFVLENFETVKTRDNIKYDLCKKHNINLLYFSHAKKNYRYRVYNNFDDILKIVFDKKK